MAPVAPVTLATLVTPIPEVPEVTHSRPIVPIAPLPKPVGPWEQAPPGAVFSAAVLPSAAAAPPRRVAAKIAGAVLVAFGLAFALFVARCAAN